LQKIVFIEKQISMKKFWKAVNEVFDWLLIVVFSAILFGGGAYVIKDILF
jgi:hypothetical protein